MAEAAASEKGGSTDKEVRGTPLLPDRVKLRALGVPVSTFCAGVLKQTTELPSSLQIHLVRSLSGPGVPRHRSGSQTVCFGRLLHLSLDRCGCKERPEGEAHPRGHPAGKGLLAARLSLLPFGTRSVAWISLSSAAVTSSPLPCKSPPRAVPQEGGSLQVLTENTPAFDLLRIARRGALTHT